MTSGHRPASDPTAQKAPEGPAAVPTGANPRRLLGLVFWAVTIGCLSLVAIVPPGATRVFAWPWSLAYAAVLLAPVGIVVLRALDAADPLVLPETGWRVTAIATATVITASALQSPYRAPSLLWSAPWLAAVAVFLAVFDALHGRGRERARDRIATVLLALAALVGAASIVEWLLGIPTSGLAGIIAARNPFPLGHPNYTAGLAIVMLPWCGAAALRAGRRQRALATVATVLAVVMLFSSGSRGGFLALLATAGLAILAAPMRRRTKALILLAALAGAALFAAANPRVRAMFAPADPGAPPNISNVQRRAMLVAGLRMGADRPLLGWGPGTTPLAFPKYRAGLDGGAENVLQLHSVPVQLWAEFGAAGLACAAAGAWLVLRDRRRDAPAAIALAGYAVFSVFDAQLDVPALGFAVAALAAFVAAPARAGQPRGAALAVAGFATVMLATIVGLGRSDPTPRLNALALADTNRATPQRDTALLQQSLALNPDQEIAHFNLGWLLVVDDPARAARHFSTAAHLVPDKGGVYFGLGLARLNAGDRAGAARAFALEALNDPVFLLSPWWKNPQVESVQGATLQQVAADADQLAAALPAATWAGRELRYVRALAAWTAGQVDGGVVAAAADTAERRDFFRQHPRPEILATIGAQTLRRERIGYPVLMRNLDLAPPVDLWTITESSARQSPLAYLWPEKGWLPSPLLVALLDGRDLAPNVRPARVPTPPPPA
jgi:O-antigen ligase